MGSYLNLSEFLPCAGSGASVERMLKTKEKLSRVVYVKNGIIMVSASIKNSVIV